jgi:NAD(P)-dependent dehydrogenase (short-subunit alcohol dehydrogenase family)
LIRGFKGNGTEMTKGVRRVALITGASRGVGASIATMLADQGFDTVINYHSKRSRAESVAADVEAHGSRALIVQADLTKSDEASAMIRTIGETFGRLDALVLNASGGLEKGKPPEYAMDLNLTARIGLVMHPTGTQFGKPWFRFWPPSDSARQDILARTLSAFELFRSTPSRGRPKHRQVLREPLDQLS